MDFFKEALEVGGGGGEDDLVRVEGGPAAAGQRNVCEVVISEYLPGQPKRNKNMCDKIQVSVDFAIFLKTYNWNFYTILLERTGSVRCRGRATAVSTWLSPPFGQDKREQISTFVFLFPSSKLKNIVSVVCCFFFLSSLLS